MSFFRLTALTEFKRGAMKPIQSKPMAAPRSAAALCSRLMVRLSLLLAALCIAAPAARADAVPNAIATHVEQARLVGEGELRWLGLKVYSAQLFSGPAGVKLDRQTWPPLGLELRYTTSLKGRTIAESSAREIERLGLADAARRERWSSQMAALFPDVDRGDRLTGVIEPGRGTRFFHNDKPIGLIEGNDFSQAFFSIWLDERTLAPSLRESVQRRATRMAEGAR